MREIHIYYFITLRLCYNFGAAGNKIILPTFTEDWKLFKNVLKFHH